MKVFQGVFSAFWQKDMGRIGTDDKRTVRRDAGLLTRRPKNLHGPGINGRQKTMLNV